MPVKDYNNHIKSTYIYVHSRLIRDGIMPVKDCNNHAKSTILYIYIYIL